MFEQLKEQLKEIVEIADQCPDRYRERCFSILLEHFLASQEKQETGGLDFTGEWPAEFSRFVADHQLKQAVSDVFHIEEGKCEIIVKDLKTKKKATGEIRLALLIGIKHLAEEGSPNVPNEELRKLCSDHALLDAPNFTSIMKKHKNWFLTKDKDWKLTKPGEKEAANLVKELAGVKE